MHKISLLEEHKACTAFWQALFVIFRRFRLVRCFSFDGRRPNRGVPNFDSARKMLPHFFK